MYTFDSYYNGDEELSSFMNEINYIVRQANERFVQCEQKLEQFIETELIEILVDDRGNFHYRVTDKGRTQLREDGFAIPPGDNFINPWRLA
jgi:hypothetical protein